MHLDSGLALPFEWVTPTGYEWAFLCAMGVAGGSGQFSMIKAYKLAPASIVALLEYTQFIWAAVFGFFFWNELPTLNIFFGGTVVVLCTLLLSRQNTK